jgi:molybdopterin molybdotransferase
VADLPLEEAQRFVLSHCAPLDVVEVALSDALGLVLAEPVVAAIDVPPFANTSMDGYAVRAADTATAPVELPVVATVAAGSAGEARLLAGQAVRIMTGAPIPDGADAVVQVERTHRADGPEDLVVIEVAANAGQSIRPAGDDVRRGQQVLAAGEVLGPGHLALLASVGVARPRVHRRPRVGVLSTGDELVEPGRPLGHGQIHDSNRRALLPLLAQAGCDGVDLGLVADKEDEIAAAIEAAVASCDAVLTSGGVSMGDFDYVKVVLDRMSGGSMRWMQVAIKPAKPFAFGLVQGVPVFGLPGNPVSSMVSFEVLARPALRQMMGYASHAVRRPVLKALADTGLPRRTDGRLHLMRVVAWHSTSDGRVHVRSAGGQGSHVLSAMAAANALALVPDGDGPPPGGEVDVLMLAELTSA